MDNETETNLRMQLQKATSESREFAIAFLDVSKTVRYMLGIAEKGTGKACPKDVRPEKYLLDYVQHLERLTYRPDKTEGVD